MRRVLWETAYPSQHLISSWDTWDTRDTTLTISITQPGHGPRTSTSSPFLHIPTFRLTYTLPTTHSVQILINRGDKLLYFPITNIMYNCSSFLNKLEPARVNVLVKVFRYFVMFVRIHWKSSPHPQLVLCIAMVHVFMANIYFKQN